MTARMKIDEMTYAWYGFALVGAISNLAVGGVGFVHMSLSLGLLVTMFVAAFYIGRALAYRNKIVRLLVMGAAVIGMPLGPLLAWPLLSLSFTGMLNLGLAVAFVVLCYRSLQGLRDPMVVRHFAANR